MASLAGRACGSAPSCLRVTGDLGLQLETIHLTAWPMAVEGLVIDQSPPPGTKVRRGGTLAVQIWHPATASVAS